MTHTELLHLAATELIGPAYFNTPYPPLCDFKDSHEGYKPDILIFTGTLRTVLIDIKMNQSDMKAQGINKELQADEYWIVAPAESDVSTPLTGYGLFTYDSDMDLFIRQYEPAETSLHDNDMKGRYSYDRIMHIILNDLRSEKKSQLAPETQVYQLTPAEAAVVDELTRHPERDSWPLKKLVDNQILKAFSNLYHNGELQRVVVNGPDLCVSLNK